MAGSSGEGRGLMWADSWGPRGVVHMGPIEWGPFGTHEQAVVGLIWATHILPMHI